EPGPAHPPSRIIASHSAGPSRRVLGGSPGSATQKPDHNQQPHSILQHERSPLIRTYGMGQSRRSPNDIRTAAQARYWRNARADRLLPEKRCGQSGLATEACRQCQSATHTFCFATSTQDDQPAAADAGWLATPRIWSNWAAQSEPNIA